MAVCLSQPPAIISITAYYEAELLCLFSYILMSLPPAHCHCHCHSQFTYRISSNKSNTPFIQKYNYFFALLIIRTCDSNNSNGTFSGIN